MAGNGDIGAAGCDGTSQVVIMMMMMMIVVVVVVVVVVVPNYWLSFDF